MAYKIVKTDSYQRDLDGVVGYIALSLVNKTAAVSLLDAVEKVYDDLERMPLMYEACNDPRLRIRLSESGNSQLHHDLPSGQGQENYQYPSFFSWQAGL